MTTYPPTPHTPSPTRVNSLADLSPTSTVVDEVVVTPPTNKCVISHISKIDEVFEIHDTLVNDTSDQDLPFSNIVSLGGQSAGKTTVLSMITKIPLWSAGGRATVCPTRIHSRYRPNGVFHARIEIQVSRPLQHVSKRVPLTTFPIKDITKLADAMRMAGLAAKKFGNGDGGDVKTYEEVTSWSDETLESWVTKESKSKPLFTENIVILHVSGPGQVNVSIIDMPGLTGDQLVEGMIEAEISKPSNLILCCASGAGRNLTPGDREFQLVKKHDPQAKRSIFIVTMADMIQNTSHFEEQLAADSPTWSLKPAHGWWFVSPKTAEQNEERRHETLIRQREETLFFKPLWNNLKKLDGFNCGTDRLRKSLYGVFADLVVKQADSLKAMIRERMDQVQQRIDTLPKEIEEPVETLHVVIDALSTTIQDAMTTDAHHAYGPFDLQRNLHLKLFRKIPAFMPFRRADIEHEQAKTYKHPSLGNWSPSSTADRVYLDEVFSLVQRYTSPRDGLIGVPKLKPHYIAIYASQWKDICRQHIDAVWTSVAVSLDQLIEEHCKEYLILRPRLQAILQERKQGYIQQSLSIVETFCRRELEDPNAIDIPDTSVSNRAELIKHFENAFKAIYPSSNPSSPSSPTGPAVTLVDADSSISGPLNRRSGEAWPPMDLGRRWAIFVMAASTVWLVEGVLRISTMVDRETQAQVKEFLAEIKPSLRKDLGLNRVTVEIEEEIKGLLEPEPSVAEERRDLKKRKMEYEALSEKFKVSRRY